MLQGGTLALQEGTLALQEGTLVQQGGKTLSLQGGISLQGLILSGKLLFVSFQFWHIVFDSPGKMTISTKLDEKLEGVDNFRAWKDRVMLVLEENDLEGFIEAGIPEP